MPVELRIEDPSWSAAIARIDSLAERAAHAAIAQAGLPPERCEISVLLTSDDSVHSLNQQFRGRDAPTNVLSWPSLNLQKPLSSESELLEIARVCGEVLEEAIFLGDVALAFGVVKREADSAFKNLEAHLSHLIVHGVLHLLGYDHEDEDEAEAMESLEIAALSAIGVADPYRGGSDAS